MRFIRGTPHSLSEPLEGVIPPGSIVGVTIGNFDGMHIGHQALLQELNARLLARSRSEERMPFSVLLTFEPHPRYFLRGLDRDQRLADPSAWSLTPLRVKLELAERLGVDCFFAARFNRAFSELSPEAFIEQFLVQRLGARLVVAGYDWGFGRGRAGSVQTLRQAAAHHGFEVRIAAPVTLRDGRRVSSSLVREELLASRLDTVRALLGRPFELSGRVRHGEKRGRKLGWPTANLEFPGQLLPRDGVYATVAHVGGTSYPSVANLGVRPTFGHSRRVLEVHLLGVRNIDIYGARMSVELIEMLREERRFASIDELTRTIAEDAARARAVLEARSR